MANLFKRAAAFTDIHFGKSNDNRTHNQDCEDFIIWFVEEAKKNNCETCIFLGDWNHNRASVNVSTMNYSVSNLERLSNSFEQVYLIMGNHDEYYKDKREIHSVEFGRLFPNIKIINEPFTAGNVTLLPWLIGDEWKSVSKITSKYIFGHLELPNFYMNAMVQMPDHGQLQVGHFTHQDYVFSGHFHKRQTGRNITYMGNAFPHNYADAGDDDRGMMILDWDGEPQFITWPDQPVYRFYKLSQVLEKAEKLLRPKMYCRVHIDIPISFEEANFLKEQFVPQFNLREFMLIPEKNLNDVNVEEVNLNFESVDSIVVGQIGSIDTESYDKQLLLNIYNNL